MGAIRSLAKLVRRTAKAYSTSSKSPKFSDILGSVGYKASEYLNELLDKEGVSESSTIRKKWAKFRVRYFDDSVLDLDGQVRVLEQSPDDIQKFRERKAHKIEEIHARDIGSLDEAAWMSIDINNSSKGAGLKLGFKNSGCMYWKEGGEVVGCNNCGYWTGTGLVSVNADNLINQFQSAIDWASGKDYKMVEFLGDGSFLCDLEVYKKARSEIFKRLHAQDNVERVFIESRPEHITEERLEQLIQQLRPDQRLDIGIGLETTDIFIGNFCINKGYGKKEFEEKVDLIARLNEKHGNRIGVGVYTLVKPAYLTETQAIEDAVKTGTYTGELARQHDFPIYTKLEPAVVPDATLLDVLYEDGRYMPPSYWSIVEIVASLSKANATDDLRTGAREDMDEFKAISVTYSALGTFSGYDFVLYDSVRKFNTHNDIAKLLGDIEHTLGDQSLRDWKQSTGIEKPVFENLYEEHREAIDAYKATAEFRDKHAFLKKLYGALDVIEYGEESQQSAREEWAGNTQESQVDIQEYIQGVCSEHVPDAEIEVDNIELLSGRLDLLRMQIKVTSGDYQYDVWAGIPTTRRVTVEEVGYD